MQNLKNKTLAISIAILLTISIATSIALIPTANAHSPPWQIPTFAYIAATPNPIGIGQTTAVGMWLTNVFDAETVNNDYRFHNFKITVTAPNGDVKTQTFDIATPDSFVTYYLTPDQVGTYTLTFNYPGQAIADYGHDPNSAYVNDTYMPSSATSTLTVQQDPIAWPPGYPLPTQYWTYPIYGQNTGWTAVASNYIYPGVAAYSAGAVRYKPSSTAPNSGHIMWTDPIQFGGVNGADSPVNGTNYFDGRSYLDRFNNPIIISGTLYFALPVGSVGTSTNSAYPGGYVAIDLRTGQQLWKNYYSVLPSFGVIFNTVNPNQYGTLAYLIAVSGSTWIGYDAYTGLWQFNITNVPSGWAGNYGPNGEPVIYTLHVGTGGTGNWLSLWNFTDVLMNGNVNYLAATRFNPAGYVVDTNTRLSYEWNVTLPNLPAGSTKKWAIDGDILLGASSPTGGLSGTQWGGVAQASSATFFALSLKPSSRGALLWQQTYTTPNNITFQLNGLDTTNRVFVISTKETMQFYGYSLDTGNQLWGPVGNLTAYNYYSTIGMGNSGDVPYIAYGNFYVGGYGGIIYCFNDATGALQWTYGNGGAGNNTNSGFATPYGNYPNFIGLIADGKVYIYNGNHGNGVPYYQGEKITCLNATTGKEIWSQQAEVEVGGFEDYEIPVADGYIAYLDCYSMQVTSIGKGPSQTTVQTTLTGIKQGDNLVIQGTVMDISAGTKQTQQAADFPNGVPAVSDDSESAWMQYVYMQYPMPANVTGVPVTIYAVDPNGNQILLGETTTDSSGAYSIEINTNNLLAGPGLYKVTPVFAGSNSYYGSSAVSSFTVTSAATAAQTPVPLQSVADMYFVPAIAGLFVLIIIVLALVVISMLRKRQ